jgi:hypothetical protein
MKLLLSPMWLEPSQAQGSPNQCNGSRFFVSTFWLLPQVFFLPCSVVMDPPMQNPGSCRDPS